MWDRAGGQLLAGQMSANGMDGSDYGKRLKRKDQWLLAGVDG
jgi:hypothetical protein